MNDLISDLQLLIRQPSVSAKNNGMIECSHLVKKIMENAGIKTELLFPSLKYESCKDGNFDTVTETNKHHFIPPIVYGEVKSKKNPHGKTLLF